MKSEGGSIKLKHDTDIGWIVLENPTKLNAISIDMVESALSIVNEVEASASIKVAIMRGAGEKAFCAGGDISQFNAALIDEMSKRRQLDLPERLQDALAGMSKPLIAMIHGHCLGGGMGLALCADVRFAAPDSKFGIPAARRGVVYSLQNLQRLASVVGASTAKDLMFSSRTVAAEEALKLGLINRVIDKDNLERETIAYARSISENAALSVRAAKFYIGQLEVEESQRDYEKMRGMFETYLDSRDFDEATRSFTEKRKPKFD